MAKAHQVNPLVTRPVAVSVADAKRQFSQLLGRVSFGGETVTITKRGRPIAKLVPVEIPKWSFYDIKPIEDEGFFEEIDRIVANRLKDTGTREVPFTGPEWDEPAPPPRKRKRKR